MKRLTLFLLLGSHLSAGYSALLNLTQSPIALSTSVPSNVFIDIDDSGSMDWEILIKPFWEMCAYDSRATGSPSVTTTCGTYWTGDDGIVSYANGQFLNFNYIFHNSDNIYNVYNPTGCNYDGLGINAIQACPTAGSNFDWRVFSHDLNANHYDPSISYQPWQYNCTPGTPCANANFSLARGSSIPSTTGFNLTKNLAGNKYEVWIDDRGFSGTRPLRAAAINATSTSNNIMDLWDSHVSIVLNAANIQVFSVTYAPNASGLNATQTLRATLTDTAQCYNVLGPDSLVRSIFNGSLGYTSTGADGCLTITEAKQNYANWYQYNRRRSFAAKGAVAYVINLYPDFRYGLNSINNNFFVQFPPGSATDFSSYNTALLSTLMNYDWQPEGTPNRSGLNRVGQYYKNNLSGMTNPIIAACQQNYTIFLTDGYWDNPDSNGMPSYIGNADGDGISSTFADVAYYYYKSPLQASFTANQVVPSAWDPATWLHMVTFTMGFGIYGNLVAGADGWPTPPLAINGNWGNPFNTPQAKADDLWHAAFNSKGNYFGSQDPSTAGNALNSIFSNIVQRAASYASVAQNSTTLNTSSQIYQATVNGTQGDVQAYSISTSGQLSSTPAWSANCKLTGGACTNPVGTNTPVNYNTRVVITRNWTGENEGIAFRWPSNYRSYRVGGVLPTNMTNFLSEAPFPANTSTSSQITANQNYGQALVDYLRGRRTQEVQNGGSYGFRSRSSLLGDIINSSPVYVSPPTRLYPDSLEASPYSAFKQTYASRTPMVYVGANDGMLHAFNTNTGQEILAYIPGVRQIYENLPNLSLPTYTHNFFVDGTPTEADVYTNNAWRTMLVGNLKNGGQGVYGIDITNPNNFTEANAGQIYMWEFTDEDDADLGYVQGNLTVAKIPTASNKSEWAVIFGNGYNNSQADGDASTTGRAALFILLPGRFSGTWNLNQNYYKIVVGTGSVGTPNGLAAPYAIDINGDYVIDYIYAGDLQGNLRRFNTNNSSPNSWTSTTLFTASFATAGDQPITAQPIVGPHPNGLQNGVMVYFGTGIFLQPSDNSTTNQITQSFYAIWDKLGSATVTKNQLIQQQILGQVSSGGSNFRLVSSNPINWLTTPSPQNLGWYMNLIESNTSSNNGERVISQPILRNNNVIFSTVIPSTNICVPGGSSWIMEVMAASGGTPTLSPYDVNRDGQFSTADYLAISISGSSTTKAASGVQSSVGMTGTPAVFLSPDKQTETKVLSGSQGLGTVTENPGTGPTGRQNWRQLY